MINRIKGTAFNDTLNGTANDEWLLGGDGDDLIFGYAGADQLLGGSGNDSLWGGRDSDRLDGGQGKDLLDGGLGSDTLTGGGDSDIFAFEITSSWVDNVGHDVVTDFVPGVDRLQFDNVTFAHLNFGQIGADTVITFDHDWGAPHVAAITLVGVDLNTVRQIAETDFIFV